jgi:enoyl-CoA hydratase/carnithine racemase
MAADIECEQIDHVMVLRLNRPEAMNTVTSGMYADLTAALQRADADPHTRAVVVTGVGKAFCVGADIKDLNSEEARALTQGPAQTPFMTAVPVVAAINGACAGVGLMLALQSDVRFVSESARLATSFSRRGMIAEQEMAWLLTTIVGRGRASDLLLSGRTFTGAEALTYGLAQFAVPAADVFPSALAYAADLTANCSPRAAVAIKQQLAEAPSMSATASRGVGQRLALEAFDWPDFAEGAASWLERRSPNFPGYSI